MAKVRPPLTLYVGLYEVVWELHFVVRVYTMSGSGSETILKYFSYDVHELVSLCASRPGHGGCRHWKKITKYTSLQSWKNIQKFTSIKTKI